MLNAFLLSPQNRLLLTIVRVYKLYLLTYLNGAETRSSHLQHPVTHGHTYDATNRSKSYEKLTEEVVHGFYKTTNGEIYVSLSFRRRIIY